MIVREPRLQLRRRRPRDNDALRLRVWPRRWSEKNKHFTVDTDTTPKDRHYAEHTLPGMRFRP